MAWRPRPQLECRCDCGYRSGGSHHGKRSGNGKRRIQRRSSVHRCAGQHLLHRLAAVVVTTQTQQFMPWVTSGGSVTWSVDSVTGGNATVGNNQRGRALHTAFDWGHSYCDRDQRRQFRELGFGQHCRH